MSTYAIGDIQGCYATLLRLLERIESRPEHDRLWLVGDLVNRGPRSLEVLRWARGLGDQLSMVLGNHDLHFIALALGCGIPKPKDTLDAALSAPDREALVDWLRRQPLLHRNERFTLVHAGLLPEWGWDDAERWARRLEEVLRGPDAPSVLRGIYRPRFPAWADARDDEERLQLALAALTRLRFVDKAGRMDLRFKGPPEMAPPRLTPWFEAVTDRAAGPPILFGHWSALGHCVVPGGVALDSGCYLRRSLTAFRIDDGAAFTVRFAD
jgi:bis(5'-nucleosyl)-tetraphosphatase (symmetrical)